MLVRPHLMGLTVARLVSCLCAVDVHSLTVHCSGGNRT